MCALDPTATLPGSRLTSEQADGYLSRGMWRRIALSSHLASAVAAAPDRVAGIAYDQQTGQRIAMTYRELDDAVSRVAYGLRTLGVGPGDTVSVMLPNRLEFAVLIWAISQLGAVYSGIPVAYGSREAGFMLRRTRAKVLVVSDRYKRTDFVELSRNLRAEAPSLQRVVVVGDAPDEPGYSAFADLAAGPPLERRPEVEPSALVHVGFTSGTTGEPKGVMNSHQTLDAVMRRWVAHVGDAVFADGVVNLVGSPIGHHTGYLWGVLLSAYVAGTAVYLDRWEPDAAADIIAQEGVTMMIGAPTFLQDLTRLEGISPGGVPSLRMIVVAGAPVPRELPSVGRQTLGCFICPAWGMTEYGIGVSAAPPLPADRLDATDGTVVEGCELRIVTDRGTEAQPGEIGELQIRGGGLFLGYLDRPDFTEEAFVDGWFITGDRAARDAEGFVVLHGRSKDIIIRGGENIPVVEVESLLYRHPAVLDAAVIGLPDERLGERACAVLACKKGVSLELADVVEFLLEQGLSKHFLPERLETLDKLPKTMSGKIRKVELRQYIANRATEPTARTTRGIPGAEGPSTGPSATVSGTS